ncbi:MAG TPA: TAXI family TRAP transporter solute-binding subunit, partial [Anaerovoracaceae bacterium]|nr:TAXI family TRAP transporter solute-binding subunit [Anaerovoracaceae bacterium]
MLVFGTLFGGCGGTDEAPADTGGAETPSTPATTTEISIAAAGAGGAIYPVCAAISDVLTRADVGVNASVQTTGGIVENLKLVNTGESDLGVSSSYLIYNAANGIGQFEGAKMDNLAILFSNFSVGTMHLLTPANSDIKSYGDLGGHQVGCGPSGGGQIVSLMEMLTPYGADFNSIKASYVSYEEGINATMDGDLDASIAQAQYPIPAIQTLIASGKDFKLISMEDDIREQFLKDFPNYVAVDIPADVYQTDTDIKAIGTPNIMVIRKDLPEELVYNILTAMFDESSLETIHASHSGAAGINLEDAASMLPVDLHPGAVKFYKEKGIIQ